MGDHITEKAPPSRLQKRLRPLAGLAPGRLLVHEIFASIQGESSYAGRPCIFVRTTACNLRCTYCDTRHAFVRGTPMALPEVVAAVTDLGLPLVEITGGEPLLQPAVLPLMAQLCDLGMTVMCETSGSLPIDTIDPRVVRVVDFKTPSSGEVAANDLTNIPHLSRRDEVKFVIGSREDYDWASGLVAEHSLARRCTLLMGTVYGALDDASLVAWILADRLPVRFQVQLHKVIWHPDRTGV